MPRIKLNFTIFLSLLKCFQFPFPITTLLISGPGLQDFRSPFSVFPSWKRVCGHAKNCPIIIKSAKKTMSDKLPCAMAVGCSFRVGFFVWFFFSKRHGGEKEIGGEKRWFVFFFEMSQVKMMWNCSTYRPPYYGGFLACTDFYWANLCWSPWTKHCIADGDFHDLLEWLVNLHPPQK